MKGENSTNARETGNNVRKATVTDGVSGHVLKECGQQLCGAICEVIKCSLNMGKY